MSEFEKDSAFKQEADRQESYKQGTLWKSEDDNLETLRQHYAKMEDHATIAKQASLQMELDPLIEDALDLIRRGNTAQAVGLLEQAQDKLRYG